VWEWDRERLNQGPAGLGVGSWGIGLPRETERRAKQRIAAKHSSHAALCSICIGQETSLEAPEHTGSMTL
jgi:hypothetical protein